MITPLLGDRKRHPLLHISCAAMLVFAITIYPTTVFATDESPPIDPVVATSNTSTDTAPLSETTHVEASTETPQEPVPDDPYVFNETTGQWENSTYTWNPTTYQTAPKTAPTYSYNPSTGMWDTTEWRYDTSTGAYIEQPISLPTPPSTEIDTTDKANSNTSFVPTTLASEQPAVTPLPSTTSEADNDTSKGIFDLFYNASISNLFNSEAHTGDATVSGNTLGGDATSGTATVVSTILNLLQSSWNYMAHGGFDTFVSNMFGNIFGDIVINPDTAATNAATPNGALSVNVAGSGNIENDISLTATSGEATIANNTEAGSATTGGAHVIANLINSISSYLSSGSSFLGVLNIFGNLDGDVLLPTDLKNLLASTHSPVVPLNDLTMSTDTSQSITSSVDATALSGEAAIEKNTSAGSATTGEASNAVTVLNLTGRQIIGKNALLVFVNVFGQWLGLIVDNPYGAKTAVLGDGTSSSATLPDEISTSETQTITNNLDLTAKSGDALVTKNTSAGNATSGDATTTANIVNILGSHISLSDWFGILFINIFGDWKGSFGVDTEAGETPQVLSSTVTSPPSVLATSIEPAIAQLSSTLKPRLAPVALETSLGTDDGTRTPATTLAAVSLPLSGLEEMNANNSRLSTTTASPNYTFSALATLTGISILAGERFLSNRRRPLV